MRDARDLKDPIAFCSRPLAFVFASSIVLYGKLYEERSPSAEQAMAKKQAFIQELRSLPIAINTADANRQREQQAWQEPSR